MNRMNGLAIAALFPLLIVGCTLHSPQNLDHGLPLPPSFAEAEAEGAESPLAGRWWEAFADARLDSLMEEAFAGNLDLARGYARLEQLRAARKVTLAGSRPILNLEGQGKREMQPSFAGDFTGNSHRLSAAAGYEVDLWRKLESRTEGASLREEGSREDLKALYLSLSAQLADLYFLAVEQRAQLDLIDGTIASFTENLELVERRYREGLVPALDLYQARQNLTAAKAQRPLFEAGLARAEHALSVLLGRYPGEETAGTLRKIPPTPEAFPAGLPSELLARRPDVRGALRRLAASDSEIAAAVAERFPALNLLGGYGTSRSDFSTGLIKGEFWSLTANLLAPVIDGGRRRAEVERRRALFREDLAGYRQTVLRAFQEVEDALAANRTGEERIAGLEERQEASEAALRLALDRYMQGLSDYLPVLTAQRLDFDSRSFLLTARRQLISDRIGLARSLGGDWMEGELLKRVEENRKGSNS